jgi:hypothetical protein
MLHIGCLAPLHSACLYHDHHTSLAAAFTTRIGAAALVVVLDGAVAVDVGVGQWGSCCCAACCPHCPPLPSDFDQAAHWTAPAAGPPPLPSPLCPVTAVAAAALLLLTARLLLCLCPCQCLPSARQARPHAGWRSWSGTGDAWCLHRSRPHLGPQQQRAVAADSSSTVQQTKNRTHPPLTLCLRGAT